MVLVEHSGDEDGQGEGAKKDKENSTGHKDYRVGRSEVLTLLDKHVSEVSDLFSLEVTQVRVPVAEGVYILVLELLYFVGVL